MLLSTVKKIMTTRLKRDIKVPADDELEDALFESLYNIATECEPSELIVTLEDTEEFAATEAVLRSLPDGMFIKVPEYPDLSSTTKHLMIDEELSYAAIYLSCSLLMKDANKAMFYTQKARSIIGLYKANYGKEIE